MEAVGGVDHLFHLVLLAAKTTYQTAYRGVTVDNLHVIFPDHLVQVIVGNLVVLESGNAAISMGIIQLHRHITSEFLRFGSLNTVYHIIAHIQCCLQARTAHIAGFDRLPAVILFCCRLRSIAHENISCHGYSSFHPVKLFL